jgi:hypothetical protein
MEEDGTLLNETLVRVGDADWGRSGCAELASWMIAGVILEELCPAA